MNTNCILENITWKTQREGDMSCFYFFLFLFLVYKMQTQKENTVKHRSNIKAEAEKVIGIIHPVHQKLCEVETSIERIMSKHVSSDLVEHMYKIEE